ncbi:hypothetical protein [Streptomyces sp. NPDC051554]
MSRLELLLRRRTPGWTDGFWAVLDVLRWGRPYPRAYPIAKPRRRYPTA